MSTIQTELDALKAMSETAQAKTTEAEDVVRVQLEAIRQKVKKGESTGDRLRDFALVHWNDDIEGRMAKVFHGVEDQLKGKSGQLAAIVEYSRRCLRDDHGPLGPLYDRVISARLGFLSGEELHLFPDSAWWGLPCDGHLQVKGPAEGYIAGAIRFDDKHTTLEYAMGVLGLGMASMSEPDRHPDIIVGDEEVIAAFTKDLSLIEIIEFPRDTAEDLLLRMTLDLPLPSGHRFEAMRVELRDQSLKSALDLERFIANDRFSIESSDKMEPSGVLSFVKNIRVYIEDLHRNVELAVKLGVDPQLPEILRIRENFGRYWEKK